MRYLVLRNRCTLWEEATFAYEARLGHTEEYADSQFRSERGGGRVQSERDKNRATALRLGGLESMVAKLAKQVGEMARGHVGLREDIRGKDCLFSDHSRPI